MSIEQIARQMAETKVEKFKDERWNRIKKWQRYFRSDVRTLLSKGWVIPYQGSSYDNRMSGYYYPAPEFYEKYIKPEIKKITHERQLTDVVV
jgi:hypothetical protein